MVLLQTLARELQDNGGELSIKEKGDSTEVSFSRGEQWKVTIRQSEEAEAPFVYGKIIFLQELQK